MKKLYILSSLLCVLLLTSSSFNTAKQDDIDITGNWTVSVKQEFDNTESTYKVKCVFKQKKNRVTGEMVMEMDKIESVPRKVLQSNIQTLKVKGEIINGHLQFTYVNSNSEISHFGSGIIRVESNQALKGKFVGYGPESKDVITGEMAFERAK